MRLVSAQLRGFKRFEKEKINLDGKVIAIVGPNEAGKSSILQALIALENDRDLSRAELTRGLAPEAITGSIIEIQWALDDDDRAAVAEFTTGTRLQWLVVHRGESRGVNHYVLPRISRVPDTLLAARDALDNAATALVYARGALEADTDDEQEIAPLRSLDEQVKTLQGDLANDVDTVPEDVLDRVRGLIVGVHSTTTIELPGPLMAAIEPLEALVAYHSSTHPSRAAAALLYKRTPDFLEFNDEARSLASDYDLAAHAATPPVALGNLARLAGLDLVALSQAIALGDWGAKEELLEDANSRLKQTFEQSWGQGEVVVRLTVDTNVLRILVSNQPKGYSSIADRSDGLRAFVALLSASAQSAKRSPVLLIDEADVHLHYDAQADLVRVLSRQEVASQVIYTTHSAGCLPQDLGTGIRVVVPAPQADRSKIHNTFWEMGPGFSPLLMGMGASTFAFSSARYAVMTEGGSDVVLLPSLFREVTGVELLSFQVAPGLAEVRSAEVARLDHEAGRTVYLVDNDDAGRAIRGRLTQRGIDAARILTLAGHGDGGAITIEDVLHLDTLTAAVNTELDRSGRPERLAAADLQDTGRAAAIAAWCEGHGFPAPNKVSIAYRVIDQRDQGRTLVSGAWVEGLRALHREIEELLQR